MFNSTSKNGWRATLDLDFYSSAAKTWVHRKHHGPLTVQRPFYPEGDLCHLYVLHPPGGVVGGDSLSININAGAESRCLLTAPGAMKFYSSSGDDGNSLSDPVPSRGHSTVVNRITIDDGSVEWLPQENIFFNGCLTNIATEIELNGKSDFIGWDIQCFGRPASDLLFQTGYVSNRFQVRIDGVLAYVDRVQVEPGARVDSMTGLRQNTVLATFVARLDSEPESLENHGDMLAAVRSRLDVAECVATVLDGLLIVRYLGGSTEVAKKIFTELWVYLRPIILGREASLPRIWAT